MKVLFLTLLAGLASGTPTFSEKDYFKDFTITEDRFRENEKIYTSEHDIVKIVVPPLRFYDPPPEKKEDAPMLFFVQGDYKEDGTFENKGIFVLQIKTGEATKLLDNGVDITLAGNDNSKKVYFAATDGIYVYNVGNNNAEKYGSVNDSIISIAKAKTEDAIYALNVDKELYQVTDRGEKKVKVDDVKNANQIILDGKDNIYFYDDKKKIYVFTKKGLKKIDDLPGNPNKITLVGRVDKYSENGISVIADNKEYGINDEGRLERDRGILLAQPTAAYFSDVGIYFGYKKSIYQSFR